MDKLIKKLLVATGILTCAALALIPLTSYAADGEATEPVGKTEDSKQATINVTVAGTLTLEVTKSPSIITVAPDAFASGTLSAKVVSNSAYNILLNAWNDTSNNGTSLGLRGRPSVTIPAKGGPLETEKGAGWGIKKKIDAGTDEELFTAITLDPEVFYTSQGPSSGTTPVEFTVGVVAGPNQQAGTYNTFITVTASSISSSSN